MHEYRVINLQSETIDPEPQLVKSSSPEKAAELVLGTHLVRSGAKKDLRARVYWQNGDGATNMVRLYSQVEGGRQR